MSDGPRPKRLHPGSALIKVIKGAPEQLLAGPAAIALISESGLWGALLALAVIAGISLFFSVLGWWRFTYTILPDEMYIESGIFNRNKRSIPWDRIQDVDIERGPLARLFGLAKVKLETGGGGSDEGLLDSIALADAHALRDEIRARRGVATPSVGEGVSDVDAPPPVFHMPLLRVLQAGLFNFSVLWFALILGGAQYFGDWFSFGWDEAEDWMGGHKTELLGMISPLNAVIAVVAFLIFGTVSGIIETLVRNYGFTLSVDGSAVRRVRGLFTRSEVAIPVHRIQLVKSQAHWIKRRLGLLRVDALTLGGSGIAGGAQELAPLANRQEAQRVMALAGGYQTPDPSAMVRVARVHPWLDVVENAIAVSVVAGVAAIFWSPALWGLILIPLIGVASFISDRPHAWLRDGAMLHVRAGWFTQTLWMLPVAHIQSITLTRGPFERRLGLATLRLDCAGGPMTGVKVQNMVEGDARALAHELRLPASQMVDALVYRTKARE